MAVEVESVQMSDLTTSPFGDPMEVDRKGEEKGKSWLSRFCDSWLFMESDSDGDEIEDSDEDGSEWETDTDGDDDEGKSWLSRLCGSWLFIFLVASLWLLVGPLLAFLYWPRLVVVCLVYIDSTFALVVNRGSLLAGDTPSAAFEYQLPVTIESDLMVNFRADIAIDAYYKDNYDTTIARGEITKKPNIWKLKVEDDSLFVVDVQATELSLAQTNNFISYLVVECGPTLLVGSWLMDLRVKVDLYGQGIQFWIRDVPVPCGDGGSATVPGAEPLFPPLSSPHSCDDNDEASPSGKYCVSFLCAIDDLKCEDSCAE